MNTTKNTPTDSQIIVRFEEAAAVDHMLTGGKGANLGRLVQAGFNVPPGYVITTAAYAQFLDAAGLTPQIHKLLAAVDYGNADALELITARIRDAIVAATMPAEMAKEIVRAYAAMGAKPYVAVRSSGTAEDLAGASFAGLHDTYLDIRGDTDLLDAVKRCWASLWSARAVSYRHTKHFNHFASPIAVVVQKMVESEVAGVMFTGNPLTDDNGEFVVNASWGLGEAIVSGIATPDEFLLAADTLAPRKRTVGGKERRSVRNPQTGRGTIDEAVPDADRQQLCLDDTQLATLGELGSAVMTYYLGIPQDIEWGLERGQFYLLQSRPVTSANFAWEADIDAWQDAPDDPDAHWTRSWADEQWCGAVTPLMYSWRALMFTRAYHHNAALWGIPEMRQQRVFKFHKAEAYFNLAVERMTIEKTLSPVLRPSPNMLNHIPQPWQDDVKAASLDMAAIMKLYARITLQGKPHNGVYAFLKTFDSYFLHRTAEADGMTNDQLRRLSDKALCDEVDRSINLDIAFCEDLWTGFYINARDAFCALDWIMKNWYTGDASTAYPELLTGVPKHTAGIDENIALWELADEIHRSPALSKTLAAHEGGEFLAQLERSDEGVAFLARYRAFVDKYPYRGHEERDMYYPRRPEDPMIDYRSLRMLQGTPNPVARENEVNTRRNVVIDEVASNILARPFGALKAEIFKAIVDWLLKFVMIRDNTRFFSDRSGWATKRSYLEMNKRLMARNVFETDRDFYFLCHDELFDVFLGREHNFTLMKAKIAARQHDFDQFFNKISTPPLHLHGVRAVELNAPDAGLVDGVLQGIGTSRGTVTGTARVVKSLANIGVLKQGDILVTTGTDPGWTPVFLMLKGIILETGGMLAHGSMLAREYGLPAVQVVNGTRLIPDGATITMNGDTGRVTIESA